MSMENPELKKDIKEINKKDWEDSAAVRMGKKEDIPNIVRALETEGMVEDVEAYIKLNKQIVVPAEDFKRLNNKLYITELNPIRIKKGDLYFSSISSSTADITMYFFDKNLNLAKVEIHSGENKIASLKNEASRDKALGFRPYISKLESELRGLGFNFMAHGGDIVYLVMSKYEREIINSAKEKTKKEFDF